MSGVIRELDRLFAERFGPRGASHLVRAPGRVNLIGEHIDYNGLAVLPMAIGRHVRLLCRPRDDALVWIANTRTEFPLREFRLTEEIPPYPNGDWGNYAKAAAQALVDRLGSLRGLDGVVDSDLPVAHGLSSSSALVVAVALALLTVNGATIDRVELMDLLARGERYVGLRGGGMDQAICLGALEGHAARVEFEPARLTQVPVPQSWRFVVASSLVPAEKSGQARAVYNRRTEECRAALEVVAAHFGVREVSYPGLLRAVHPNELTLRATEVLESPLEQRFRHVVTEAERVRLAEEALLADDLQSFGGLLDESHESLRHDYDVSTPELDELVEIARRAGARGARLTGAGLGGCAIAVCEEGRVGSVMEALEREFYAGRELSGQLEDRLFVATPAGGASVEAV